MKVFNKKLYILKGVPPIITNKNQAKKLHESLVETFKELNETNPGEADQCFITDSALVFWTGIARDLKTDSWYNPYDDKQNSFDLDLKGMLHYSNSYYDLSKIHGCNVGSLFHFLSWFLFCHGKAI